MGLHTLQCPGARDATAGQPFQDASNQMSQSLARSAATSTEHCAGLRPRFCMHLAVLGLCHRPCCCDPFTRVSGDAACPVPVARLAYCTERRATMLCSALLAMYVDWNALVWGKVPCCTDAQVTCVRGTCCTRKLFAPAPALSGPDG